MIKGWKGETFIGYGFKRRSLGASYLRTDDPRRLSGLGEGSKELVRAGEEMVKRVEVKSGGGSKWVKSG